MKKITTIIKIESKISEHVSNMFCYVQVRLNIQIQFFSINYSFNNIKEISPKFQKNAKNGGSKDENVGDDIMAHGRMEWYGFDNKYHSSSKLKSMKKMPHLPQERSFQDVSIQDYRAA